MMSGPQTPSENQSHAETDLVATGCCASETQPVQASNSDCCGQAKPRFDWLLWISFSAVALLYLTSFLTAAGMTLPQWLTIMASTCREMVHTMWWGVVMGAIFVGLLTYVSREFIMQLLGRGGTVSGLLRATFAGVFLDLCSHGILMVGAKLYERGASAGQLIAFLLASPWNSFSLTLILIGLVGFQWTLIFIVLSMLIALLSGWIFDRLVERQQLVANPARSECPASGSTLALWPQIKNGIAHTQFNVEFFKNVVSTGVRDSMMVIKWLLFGILLAALLRALLDADDFTQYFGPTMLGLLVTVLLATVMEVCSEGATPIAADILNRASAPGNGFAFLMSGVATDYTEIMVLKETTKSWRFALFLPLVTVPQVLLVAWLINQWGV